MEEARARRLTLIACILGSSIVFVDQTVANLALASLRVDLGATLADRQWVVEAYLLLLVSLVLVGGALGDVPGVVLCVLGSARVGGARPRPRACAAFVAYERVAPDPMLPPSIFRTRNFAVGNLVTLVVYAGLGAATFFVALFLQQVAGYSALEAGFALPPITLVLIVPSRRFGELSARLGPRLFMSAGPLAGGLGVLGFARLDARADYLKGVLPAGLVFGLGPAMTVVPLTATVLESADPRYAGIASASTTRSRASRACWRPPPSGQSSRRSCTRRWTGARSRRLRVIRPPARTSATRASVR
jgi:MFS family permease